jgi:hypothetical protein
VFQGDGCGRRGGSEEAPLEVLASEDVVPPVMDCGRQVQRCTAAWTSGWCWWPAKHGVVEGTLVHGGHGSGGFVLHVDHGGGHGVYHQCRRSSGLGVF